MAGYVTLHLLTDRGLIANILKKNIQCLEQLHTNKSAWLLPHELQKESKHVLLEKEAKENETISYEKDS